MLETNDPRIAEKRTEIRSMLLSSIKALTRRLAHVEQSIKDFINGCEDATMVKAVRASQLRRETGDDSLITRIGLRVLANRADDPGADLVALRDSLESRLSALNSTLDKYEPIAYVAPVQLERPEVVQAIPSPSEWAEQRLAKLNAEPTERTEEQQAKYEAAVRERQQEQERLTPREGRTDVSVDDSGAVYSTTPIQDLAPAPAWELRER
jgi:hypothetical protein